MSYREDQVPGGDGAYRVRCSKCGEVKPSDQTHIISTGSGFGRAYRCDPCGIAESRRIAESNVTRCQDCRHDRATHATPGSCTVGDCECMEFLPSQALELWELAQRMRDEPGFDPGWPLSDLIRERGWTA